jgi:hypothetical protein
MNNDFNRFLSAAKKGEQNKSKTYFSKSVQNTHFALVAIKYYKLV